ncbi:HEAT repeat domain-containing protein [Streptomyces sp. NPDC049040]|uniref:caspase, EACC1-associated type n=1 Tax=Streptomyces sp. NPDC049040 TaxID=3365593 RepID=UPI0037128EF7
MRLPHKQSSRAVLIGVSRYESAALPDLPAVRNNLTALLEGLCAPGQGAFSADRCEVLADPGSPRDVYRTLRRVAAEPLDTLLVYYAGHGLTGTQNELYLSLAETEHDELAVSGLPYALVRDVVVESPAANRVVILDCCFSGRAIQGMSDPGSTLAGQLSIEGTYVLTSTAANAVALAPEGATYTAFTGELLTLLRNGPPDGSQYLTFSVLYRELLRTMTSHHLPAPMCRGTGTVDQLALARAPEASHGDSPPMPDSPARPPESVDLLLLTRRQRERELELLVGSSDEARQALDHQHLPEMYVDRPAVRRAWQSFLESDAPVFSAVGDAGRGKTSLLCTLAAELGETSPVLFYSGSQLNGRLADALRQDLALAPAGGDPLAAAAAVARRQGHTLYVVIDALNERELGREDLRAELNEAGRSIRVHGWPVRLVVSCRTGDWLFWVRNARHMLGHFGRAVYRDEALPNGAMPGTPVPTFQPAELDAAWARYRRGFGVTGTLTRELRALCREPIFLRLVAETHRGGSVAAERTVTRHTLIDEFLDERFQDSADHLEMMALLFRLSSAILERERPSVPVSEFPPQSLPMCRRLLAEGILAEKHGALGFRFEIMLEHVVAKHVRQQLPERPTEEEVAAAVSGLTTSRLVNAPGIVENLLLLLREEPAVIVRGLEALATMDDRWRAVSCTVAAQTDLPPRRLLPAVRTLAASDNYLVRNLSADTIVQWIDRRADREVLACAEGSDWESRETVAQALGRAGSPSEQSTRLLWRLADDYHWRVRRASGYSLLRNWQKDVVRKVVREELGDLDAMSWRRRHSVCVGMLGCDLAVASEETAAIEAMSLDDNPQVRWCVANYLSRYTNAASSTVSSVLAADPSGWVRARVVTSLVGLAEQDADAIGPLLAQLAGDPSDTVRLKTARELSALGGTAAGRTLLELLAEDSSPEVSFAARYSLGLITDRDRTLTTAGGRALVLKVFRERVARRNMDLAHSQFSTFQKFISDRTETPLGEDPYMHLVDTMCSLTVAAMTALQDTPAALGELMELLEQDADEAIRWALVLFLVRYSSRVLLTESVRMAGLERLAHDPHWWVRREVANGLAEFRGTDQAPAAAALLGRLRAAEAVRGEPCGDEVFYFIDRSEQWLSAAVPDGDHQSAGRKDREPHDRPGTPLTDRPSGTTAVHPG